MRIYIDKDLIKLQLKKLAKPAAYAGIAIAVLGSTALMVERFSRNTDGSHDLSI